MAARARVTACVLNLRMGGQVSSMTSLLELVAERGYDARLALPEGVDASKAALTAFARRGVLSRARALLSMLRALPAGADDVVHLVVPTPAFAAAALAAPTPPRRVLLQYEGMPTAFDADHLRALREDPALLAPRLALNHGAWAALSRSLRCTHLATTPLLADWLRARGFSRVVEAANVARPGPDDVRPLPPGLVGPGERVVAYVGHCHPAKGVDDLVEAFGLAAPRDPALRLLLAVSEDGDARRVRRRVGALPPEARARVRLAGLVPVRSLLAAVDALVLPYRTAITTTLYPSLLLEADAAGTPIVTTRVDAFLPALDPASPRLSLVPPRDAAALARALERLPTREGSPALRLPPDAARVDAVCRAYDDLLRGRP